MSYSSAVMTFPSGFRNSLVYIERPYFQYAVPCSTEPAQATGILVSVFPHLYAVLASAVNRTTKSAMHNARMIRIRVSIYMLYKFMRLQPVWFQWAWCRCTCLCCFESMNSGTSAEKRIISSKTGICSLSGRCVLSCHSRTSFQ